MMLKNQSADASDAQLSHRLLALRRGQSLSLAELALASGVSRAMISKVERNQSSPTAATLGKLAAALGVTLAQLFSEDNRSLGRLSRRISQHLWRDPDSGYRRRQVAGRDPVTGIEIIEVELPRSARVGYPRWNSQPYRQRLWMVEGQLEVKYGEEIFELQKGDYLDFGVDRSVVFAARGGLLCRYLLVISTK
jgi:transcriptional regulator with XRE-family HTH domain